MSKRPLKQALVGLVAHVQLNVAAVKAYEVADAMIAARIRTRPRMEARHD